MKVSRSVVILGLLGLTACGGYERDIRLHDLRTNRGTPEEFSILPVKPLGQPENYAELPTPTPGSANLTDPTPKQDAVAALGGNPARLSPNGAPRSDGALIAQAGRFGVQGDIRGTLAEEDLAFRKRKSLFTWKLVPEDEYKRAYRRQSLDPYAVQDRYRNAGARTPASPPAN